MNSNSNKSLWTKLQRPKYRDAFIAANVGVQIASQLHALRTSRGRSQEKLADEIGMNQATISLMEKPEYRKYNIGTLIRFAQHYKVALDVRFVSLVDHVKRIVNETPDSLAPPPFGEPAMMPAEMPDIPRAQNTIFEEKQDVPSLDKHIPKRRRDTEQDTSDLMKLGQEVYDSGIV
jgi:transcriptional regulator with XRE-family HTH domain